MSARTWSVFAAAVGLAALTLVGTAGSASALEGVKCKEDGYFWIFQDNAAAKCFKNKGDLDVDIHKVAVITSGNNAGWFDYRDKEGKTHSQDFKKSERHEYSDRINITYMHVD